MNSRFKLHGALALVTSIGLGALIACGAEGEASLARGPDPNTDASARGDGGFSPSPGADAGFAPSSGVVIVHAASFPAFRLCFENYPDLAPQPDRTVMPEANVVGVEIGSAVRIPPLPTAPGKIYVIAQKKAAEGPTDQQRPCSELISDVFTPNLEFHEAGSITEPLGTSEVRVLAITGCGGGAYIDALGVNQGDCGGGYDLTRGNLQSRTFRLQPTSMATQEMLPVQVFHLSEPLERTRTATEVINITFGVIRGNSGGPPADAGGATAPLPFQVANAPTLFDAGPSVEINLDQSSPATYGTHGFRIALRKPDAGADDEPSFSVDQSLAEIQELSFPQAVPTTYFLAGSNYALLLLGNPRVPATIDGGRNPDLRLGVHFLAIPVRSQEDAGTLEPIGDASTEPDGGVK